MQKARKPENTACESQRDRQKRLCELQLLQEGCSVSRRTRSGVTLRAVYLQQKKCEPPSTLRSISTSGREQNAIRKFRCFSTLICCFPSFTVPASENFNPGLEQKWQLRSAYEDHQSRRVSFTDPIKDPLNTKFSAKDVEPQSSAETQKVLSNSKYGLRLRLSRAVAGIYINKEATFLSACSRDSREGFSGCIDYIWLSCIHSRRFGLFNALNGWT